MGNAVTWSGKELAYLMHRDFDILRSKLFVNDREIAELLGVFRKIDYRNRGKLGRIEFYLHFRYPFITPMADKLFHAFAGGACVVASPSPSLWPSCAYRPLRAPLFLSFLSRLAQACAPESPRSSRR